MTMFVHSPRTARGPTRFADIVKHLGQFIGRVMSSLKTSNLHGLERLDDHLLRDIGLTRADIADLTGRDAVTTDIEARRLNL